MPRKVSTESHETHFDYKRYIVTAKDKLCVKRVRILVRIFPHSG